MLNKPIAATPIKVPTSHKGRRPVVPVSDIYFSLLNFTELLIKQLKIIISLIKDITRK